MSTHVPHPKHQSRFKVIIVLGTALVVGAEAGTQMAAYRMGFHAALGAPVLDLSGTSVGLALAACMAAAAAYGLIRGRRRLALGAVAGAAVGILLWVGPIYTPLDLMRWAGSFLTDTTFRPLVEEITLVSVGGFMGCMIAMMMVWDSGFKLAQSTSHGSAKWGSVRPLLQERGLLIGKSGRKKLRYNQDGHLLTVAPTRSGKGVGPIISNLLSYTGSIVVTDPKGENYAVTHAYRRDALHHQIVALDPFNVVGGIGAINPLDMIDASQPTAIDEARRLAGTIVVSRGKGSANAAFFDEEARGLLAGFILYVCHECRGVERSLATVREMITRGEAFEELLRTMAQQPHMCHGLVARTANRILQKDERERSGVVSTAQSYTHFLDSPAVAQALSHSTVDLEALKQQRITAYMILPMDKLDEYSALLRLVVTTSFMALVRDTAPPRAGRVLFLLDEFANLGRMEAALKAVTLLAGYGATVWMFIQNLPQLKAIYPDEWEILLDVDVFQAFGTNELPTAEYVSRLTGDATVYSNSQANSRSSGKGGRGRNRSYTMAEKQRKLLTPDEVMRMGANEQVIFMKSHLPVRAERVRYFDDPDLAPRAARNPLHAEKAAPTEASLPVG